MQLPGQVLQIPGGHDKGARNQQPLHILPAIEARGILHDSPAAILRNMVQDIFQSRSKTAAVPGEG